MPGAARCLLLDSEARLGAGRGGRVLGEVPGEWVTWEQPLRKGEAWGGLLPKAGSTSFLSVLFPGASNNHYPKLLLQRATTPHLPASEDVSRAERDS